MIDLRYDKRLRHKLVTGMSSIIYHNPRCSKSRAALKALQEVDNNVRIVAYLSEPLTTTGLQTLIHNAGLTVREAIRTKEPEYQQLELANDALTDEELLAAIVAHPRLLNRPFVVTSKGTRLARSPEVLAEIL